MNAMNNYGDDGYDDDEGERQGGGLTPSSFDDQESRDDGAPRWIDGATETPSYGDEDEDDDFELASGGGQPKTVLQEDDLIIDQFFAHNDVHRNDDANQEGELWDEEYDDDDVVDEDDDDVRGEASYYDEEEDQDDDEPTVVRPVFQNNYHQEASTPLVRGSSGTAYLPAAEGKKTPVNAAADGEDGSFLAFVGVSAIVVLALFFLAGRGGSHKKTPKKKPRAARV